MKIDKEALPFGAAVTALVLLVAAFVHPLVALAPLVLLAFVVWFFRDPERTPPDDPRAVVSPADGRVLKVGPASLSVFMNVFDVHVCRAPMAGAAESITHHPGRFLAAWRDEATEHNERTHIRFVDAGRTLHLTLVAGLVARRIVCRIGEGRRVDRGERIGLIRFGSRVDVRLPGGAEVAVRRGQRVVAGETIIARMSG